MKKQLMLFFLGFFLLGCAGIVSATTIWVGTSTNNIYTVDTGTLAASFIGPTGGVQLTDVAFDDLGNLYGISRSNFYSINTGTGAATNIGPLFQGSNNMNALAFGYDTMYAAASNGYFYTVNTTTGAANQVGSMGVNSSGDLAFDSDGTLYLTATGGLNSHDRLISINKTTGAGNIIGGGDLGYSVVYGLAYDNPIMYGITANFQLLTVNTTLGTSTLVGSITGMSGNPIWGATQMIPSDIEPIEPIPEPATMLLLGTGLVGVAGAARRRRNNQS